MSNYYSHKPLKAGIPNEWLDGLYYKLGKNDRLYGLAVIYAFATFHEVSPEDVHPDGDAASRELRLPIKLMISRAEKRVKDLMIESREMQAARGKASAISHAEGNRMAASEYTFDILPFGNVPEEGNDDE